MKKKILAVLGLTLALSTGITGCTGNNSVAATMGEQEITLGDVKTYVKYQQALYEQVYSAYLGMDIDWSKVMDEKTGETMSDGVVSGFLDDYKELVIVASQAENYHVSLSDEEKQKITEAAKNFISSNSKAALKDMGATQDTVEDMLTKMTLKSRVEAAMKDTADKNVTDEEAAQKTISYVNINKEGTKQDENGNDVKLTEAELEAIKEKAEVISKSGSDFDKTVEEASYTVKTASYGKDNRDDLDEAVYTAADKLKEGEISDVIETDTSYYVVRMDSTYDEAATEKRKESIIEDREQEAYDTLYKEMEEKSGFKTVDKVWNSIVLKNKYTIVYDNPDTTDGDATSGNDASK